jgi:cellulase (glycosyl hydrolase family 5)
MKNVFKKITTVCAAAALSLSMVSCGESSEKENSKSSSNSPEKAVQNFVQGMADADLNDVCTAMAPNELWDYVCKDTGLSKEKVFSRLLGGDTLEDISKYLNKEYLETIKVSDIKIESKNDESDDAYNAFGRALSNAGIDENIDHLYYVEAEPIVDLEGLAYEIDGKWYFGTESIIYDFIEVAIEGYDALPEDYDDNDYDEDDYDASYERDNSNDEYYENTENNSDAESNAVNLCADSSNWTSYFSEENDCASTLKILSDGAALEVTKTSDGYYYYNQLGYNNIALEKDATYRLEFDYEATEDLSIEFRIQQNYEPYSGYDGEIFDALSNGIKHYSIQFTMPVNDNDVSIVFNCNNPGITLPYTFTIKNLTLVRVD